jgi:hypothetical protein
MKKIILIVSVFCLALTGFAQDREWKIALHVDPNVSWLKPNSTKLIDAGSNKMKFGFGLTIDKMFTENYAFGTGFNVVRTGGQLSYFDTFSYKKDGASSNTEVIAERKRTYNLQYLEIPLTLKLRTNEIGYITYWAQMGVGLGINIKAQGNDEIDFLQEKLVIVDDPSTSDVDEASTTWETSTIKDKTDDDIDIKDDIGIFRTSLIVAAGIEYNLSGNSSVLAGITFDNGFNNILTSKGVKKDEAGNPEIYNKTPQTTDLKAISNFIALNVGFLF